MNGFMNAVPLPREPKAGSRCFCAYGHRRPAQGFRWQAPGPRRVPTVGALESLIQPPAREPTVSRKAKPQTCSICGGSYTGYGNNAAPINYGRCCDACDEKVISKRVERFVSQEWPLARFQSFQKPIQCQDHITHRAGDRESHRMSWTRPPGMPQDANLALHEPSCQ
jgi:hypothetical protein